MDLIYGIQNVGNKGDGDGLLVIFHFDGLLIVCHFHVASTNPLFHITESGIRRQNSSTEGGVFSLDDRIIEFIYMYIHNFYASAPSALRTDRRGIVVTSVLLPVRLSVRP